MHVMLLPHASRTTAHRASLSFEIRRFKLDLDCCLLRRQDVQPRLNRDERQTEAPMMKLRKRSFADR